MSTASGPEAIFGVFGTTWYWRLDLPGVKEFVAAYQKNVPGHGRSRCRATSSTTATWPRASCCAVCEEAGIDEQHRRHQEARGPQDERARPHAARRCLDRCRHAPGASRPSTWPATTTRRRRRTTSSRSSRRPSRRTCSMPVRAKDVQARVVRSDAELRAVGTPAANASERDDLAGPVAAPRQRHLAGAAVRADRARLHAHRRRDGDHQPGARLAVRAGHVRGAVRDDARVWAGSPNCRQPTSACRWARAMPSRCSSRRCWWACSGCCSSCACAAPTGAIRCTGCC